MYRMRVKRTFCTAVIVFAALAIGSDVPLTAQSGAKNGEWRSYGGDIGHTRYSPLDQINASNFNTLEIAWRFKSDSPGPRADEHFEVAPRKGQDVGYSTAGRRRPPGALDTHHDGRMMILDT